MIEFGKPKTANLQNADLSKAFLMNCILTGVNFKNADLRGADLRGSILQNADLENVYLTEARITLDQLCDVKTLYKTKLDPKLMDQVKKYCPNLLEKPKDDSN